MALTTVVHNFSGRQVTYYFDAAFSMLEEIVSKEKAILITDENVFAAQAEKFNGWKTIVIKAGEQHKQQSTIDSIVKLIVC